jgi:hypothetical protein
MTSVVDEKQCQWCGTKSPADADRCGLCRLPFDRVVPPPRNWNPAPPETPKTPEPEPAEVPSQADAPVQEQLPIYGRQPAEARTGLGRRRRSRPLRRLMIWAVAIGLLATFLLLAPGRIGF